MKTAKLRFLCCPLIILLLLCSFAGCAEQPKDEPAAPTTVKQPTDLSPLTNLSHVEKMLQAHQSANEPVTFNLVQQIFYKADVTDELIALLDLEHWEEIDSPDGSSEQFTLTLRVEQPNPEVDVSLYIQQTYAEIKAVYTTEHDEPYQASRFFRLPQETDGQFVETLHTYLNDHNLITRPQF